VCPARRLPPAGFDIAEGPGQVRWQLRDGFRCLPDGTPVCVHPDRVGLPPGRYASAGDRWPEGLSGGVVAGMPDEPSMLAAWIAEVIRHASPERVGVVLGEIEAAAAARFGGDVVLAAIRTAIASF
jgi:hypothetical protein